MVQYSRAAAWHPEWAWSTPAGFSDYPYALNFTLLNVPANGTGRAQSIPVRGPDDADFLVRSIYLPKLAIVPTDVRGLLSELSPIPGLMRLNVAGRQSSSNEFVLTGGAWCNGGLPGLQGPGVSLVDPLVIPARGVVTFDLQLSTNARPAVASFDTGAGNVLIYANVYGLTGNGFRLMMVDPGIPNAPLEIVGGVPSSSVEVQYATDAFGAISSTWAEVVEFVNLNLSAFFIATLLDGDGSAVGVEHTFITAGAQASSPVDVVGALIGHKRKRIC